MYKKSFGELIEKVFECILFSHLTAILSVKKNKIQIEGISILKI